MPNEKLNNTAETENVQPLSSSPASSKPNGESGVNLRKERLKTYAFIFFAIGIPLFVYLMGWEKYFTRTNIIYFVDYHHTLAPVIYIIGMVFFPIIGAPRLILTAVGGALFDITLGTVYAMIGSTLAGVLGYYLAYYSAANYFEAVTTKKKNRFLDMLDFTKKNNFWLIFLARICPVTHYEAINYLCGTSKIPFRSFFWSTFFGIIPGTFVYVMMGEAVMKISESPGIGVLLKKMFVDGQFSEMMKNSDVQMLMYVGIILLVFFVSTMTGFYYIIKHGKEAEAAENKKISDAVEDQGKNSGASAESTL